MRASEIRAFDGRATGPPTDDGRFLLDFFGTF